MLKRTVTTLVCATVMCILGLGVFNEARAYEDPCNNFNFELISVERDHGDVFNYNYVVTGIAPLNISKLSFLSIGIDGNLIIDPDAGKIGLPGEGSLVDGWLEGVPQLQVITITPQAVADSAPFTIPVSGTGGNVGTVAGYTKAGNKIETCFIEGPVTGLPVDASVPSSKVVNLLGKDFCIDLNPRTGCPDPNPVVYECADPDNVLEIDLDFKLGGSAAFGDPQGPTTPTIVMGEGSDPRCPVSKVAHNPCQCVCIGGTCYGAYCW